MPQPLRLSVTHQQELKFTPSDQTQTLRKPGAIFGFKVTVALPKPSGIIYPVSFPMLCTTHVSTQKKVPGVDT